MKNYIITFCVSLLTFGIIKSADAQRSRGSSGGGRSSGGGGGVSRSTPSFNSRGSNPVSSARSFNTRPSFQRPSSNVSPVRSSTYRNIPSSFNRPSSVPGNNYQRNSFVTRNNSYAYNTRNVSRGYYGGGGYYSHAYFRGFAYGPRYSILPYSSVSLFFGGYPYYFYNGFYYGYYGGYYEPIFPPIGLRIGFLPYGYTSLFIGGFPYYYYNGIYYQQYDDNQYQVVDPPMGASVYSLPQGAKSVVLNGEKLYELNGTYYKEDRDAKGQTIYVVVGKNGEINNTNQSPEPNNIPNNNIPNNNVPNNNVPNNNNNNIPDNNYNNNTDQNLSTPPPSLNLKMGDIISQVPQGSRIVTINGEKMYVTPDDTYLKEENIGGTVQYEVVGK